MWWIALANAADLQVGPGRPFAEPQDAVDAAAPGDRILVDAGTYLPLTIGVDVEIVGLGPAVIVATDQQAVEVAADVVLRGLVLDGAGSARALAVGVGAELVVEDSVLRNGASEAWGGCVHVDDATVTLRRTTLTGCVAQSGGGLYANASDLVLDAVTITGSTATGGFGGGVGIEGSTLFARGCRFEGNLADDSYGDPDERGLGGGLFTGRSTIELHGCTFVDNQARSVHPDAGRGGAIRLWMTDAIVEGGTFDANIADELGSGIGAASSTLALSGSELVQNLVDEMDPQPSFGGVVFCDEGSDCTVTRSWFEANTAGDGGAIGAIGDLTVTTSMFCANLANSDGGAIDFGNIEGGHSATVAGNVFALNTAGTEGGALVVSDGPHAVIDNHLVGNVAGFGAAIATTQSAGQAGLEVIANLFASNTSTDGPVLVLEDLFVEDFDWLFDNEPISASFPPGASTGIGDPGLVGPIASCDPADLLLAPDSPLRDAGPPDDRFQDADGTRNDIGAFGGPYGDATAFADADGDGAIGMLDCADDDPGVHRDAPEVCNGIDDDCDGLVDAEDLAVDAAWSFLDADGDGVGGVQDAGWRCPGGDRASTSNDCDDQDPEVAGEVTWYTDKDGDGLGDPATATIGCTPPDGAVLVGGDCDDADPSDCGADPGQEDPGGGVGEPPEPDFGCGCGSSSPGTLGLGWLVVLALRRARSRQPWFAIMPLLPPLPASGRGLG